MNPPKPILYTVGHSNHSFEHFLGLLKKHSIEAIADVRSYPYSQYTPQFNRDNLERCLKANGISYVFLGKELGARRDEASCYEGNKVVYGKIAETEAFQKGLKRLVTGAQKMRVAIMCAEKDPLTCHRTILVAYYGKDLFSNVIHILENGEVEAVDEAETRLLHETNLGEEDLFSPLEDRLILAYKIRGEKIAYEETESTGN